MSYLDDRKQLAREILQLSRRRISGESPLLLTALYAMDDVPREEEMEGDEGLSTNGEHIYYSPEKVVEDFRKDRDGVAKQLIHIISHCLLGHLPARGPGDRGRGSASYRSDRERELEIFDAVADHQVRKFIRNVCPGLREDHWEGELSSQWENTSRLCHIMEERWNLDEWLEEVEDYYVDDHDRWSQISKKPQNLPPVGGINGLGSQNQQDWWGMLRDLGDQSQRQNINKSESGHQAGDGMGDFIQKIFAQEETSTSYQDILRDMLTVAEQERTDIQSIDPVWYNLGMELLDGVPMIEPLESGETRAVMDLVVAIDTSGSCEGSVCRRFIQELAGLLREVEEEGVRYRVLLIQCDDEIQQEVLVENQEDVERLGESFEPCGFGGTAFDPVFERVAARQEEGTLGRVSGLIYFSDGWGQFPSEAPDYPTVFLLYDSDGTPNWHVPSWVEAVALDD